MSYRNLLRGVAIALAFLATVASADPVVLNARQNQTVDGQDFTFEFNDVPNAEGEGVLTLLARGDYSLDGGGNFFNVESIDLNIDGEIYSIGARLGW